MNFRDELVRRNLTLILSTVLAVTLICFFAFTNIFENYLVKSRQEQFNNLMSSLVDLSEKENQPITNERLASFLSEWDIDVVIYDQNHREIARYSGLNPHYGQQTYKYPYDLKYVSDPSAPASMVVTDDLDSSLNVQTLRSFRHQSVVILVLAGGLVSLIAFFSSRRFAEEVTKPLEELNESTALLRNHQYDIEPPKTQITELDQLGESYAFLAQALKEQEASRRDYADDIAHELRTPLTNMQMQIEGMQDGIYEMDGENLEKVMSSARQLTSIVQKLNSSFEYEDADKQVHVEAVPVSQLANEILDSFQAKVEKHQGQIHRRIQENLIFRTDPQAFSEILDNLLSNAIKAMNKEKNEIIVDLFVDGDQKLVLLVSDNGAGIKEEDLPHIFDRFYRVDSSRNRKTGGQGLGLAIIKNMINRLGGTITVSSQYGRGTSFRIELTELDLPEEASLAETAAAEAAVQPTAADAEELDAGESPKDRPKKKKGHPSTDDEDTEKIPIITDDDLKHTR